QLRQARDAAHALAHLESASVERAEACRVVAPVFQPIQALDEQRRCFSVPNVPNNAAHASVFRLQVNLGTPRWCLQVVQVCSHIHCAAAGKSSTTVAAPSLSGEARSNSAPYPVRTSRHFLTPAFQPHSKSISLSPIM